MVGCEGVENPVVPPNNDNGEDELKFWDGSFANREWKITTGYNGPQADLNSVYCSSNLDNVWVDGQAPRRLHLKITYDDKEERWNCAQIESVKTLGGYGKYTFYIDNVIMEKQDGKKYNATELDKNVVIGLYTYDNGCSHPSKNEIDLEFSEWGDSGFREGWFIVWKDGGQLLRDRCNFPIQLVGKSSVHSFDWTENSIDFESASGSYKKTAQYPSNAFENLGGNGYIPQPLNEKVLMNIWLDGGQPYSDDMKSAEIIISNFEYSSNDQTENHPPGITSTPVTSATKDEPYSYDVNATDPDAGDTMTYSLTTKPTGMTINSSTGLISWTPTSEGNYNVTVKASDGELFDTQSFTINVSDTNHAPVISELNADPPSVNINQTTTITCSASDPDGDSLTYTWTKNGGTFEGDTSGSSVTWKAPSTQGNYTITCEVSDGEASDSEQAAITVNDPGSTNHPPDITSSPVTSATKDEPYSYDVNATDADVGDTLVYSLTTKPTGMSINSSTGLITWTPSSIGDYDVTVKVIDNGSPALSDTQSFTITVEETGTYSLRDIGPAGGYIFYDKGYYSSGWRYLEAAPVSTEWAEKEWGSKGTFIGGTGTGIGTGQSNTTIIVTWLDANTDDTYGDVTNRTNRAAYLCDNLSYGGYNDWFLPSKDELDQMRIELYNYGVGGFAVYLYWSSSEYHALGAWGEIFGSGTQHYYGKYNYLRVRAVRAF